MGINDDGTCLQPVDNTFQGTASNSTSCLTVASEKSRRGGVYLRVCVCVCPQPRTLPSEDAEPRRVTGRGGPAEVCCGQESSEVVQYNYLPVGMCAPSSRCGCNRGAVGSVRRCFHQWAVCHWRSREFPSFRHLRCLHVPPETSRSPLPPP